MDRNTILAVSLCFLIYVGWQKYYLEPLQIAQAPMSQAQAQAPTKQVPNPMSAATHNNQSTLSQGGSPKKLPPVKTLTLQTQLGEVVLGNGSQTFNGWTLSQYHQSIKSDAPMVDLKSVTLQEGEMSLAFEKFAYLSDIRGELVSTPGGAKWTYEDSNVRLTRDIQVSASKAYVDVRINAEFKKESPSYAFVSLSSQGLSDDPEAQDRQLLYSANDSLERVILKDVVQKQSASPVHFIGATNRYFLLSIISDPLATQATGLMQPTGQPEGGRMSLVYPVQGKSFSIPLKVYFGPKDLDVLRTVDPKLDSTVDFGWFTVFAYPILKVLKWLYQFFSNYGTAIIVLTVLLKLATYPLTYKSMKSMKKMAKLQPQLQKIRDRYKDDKEALNREMMTMMKNNGYNPMAGCLPILIQMPIFFALYRVLYSSIELYHAPFAFWIQDLSSRDPFYVTPVLLSLTMFVQQKLTPNTATDPAQAKMMQFMPLIFGAFMLTLPSGLTVYMLVNAIASIVQQMILNKKFDTAPAR